MAIPAAPQNVFLQQGNGDAFLSWDLVSGATSYVVQRSTDGVTFVVVSTAAPNSYLDTTVTVNTQYFYQVASMNSSGTSAYSVPDPLSVVPTISGQMSLGEIRLSAQERADRVNSQFVTLPEWNRYINQSYYELYDLLITLYEDYYVAPKVTFLTDGTQTQDLPNGVNFSGAPALYKLYGVDCGITSNTQGFASLRKFSFINRNRYVFPQITSTLLGIFDLQYRMIGGKIMFIPTPAAGQTIGLWYYPRLTTLLRDIDVMDGISGWTEYVIIDAAIKALQKEESDISALMQEKMMMKARIEESASNRDAGNPECVSDSSARGESMGGSQYLGSFGGY